MKKLSAVAIALVFVAVAVGSVTAEGVGSQNPIRTQIRTMGALGNGLAISQSNPLDFQLLKIGIAGVDVIISNETETMKVGILYFGDTKYKLKDVVIGNGSASANVYDNDTQAGSISLNSYPKGDTEIWAGTLTLNGASYNAYVIQAHRLMKAEEKADKVKDYCENNPEKCKAAMKAVGQIICDPATDGNCRDRIKNFCEQNPEDNRCKTLGVAYCRLHLEDSTCREQIIAACKLNSNGSACEKLGEVYEKKMERSAEAMKNIPEWFKNAREKTRERQLNPNATSGNAEDN
jgi:hypothetical protein